LDLPVSDESEAGRTSARSEIAVACLLATAVGLLGLLPHLAFMYEVGEFRYFHGAYDEDSYVLSWLRGTLRPTRALSGAALSVLYAACASSLDATLIASDFVFPFLATCAAYFAVSQLLTGRMVRVLGTLLLVFANDFFSLGNLVVWSNAHFNIVTFSRAVQFVAPNLVPSYETHFLSIFRTPEPQVSFALMFLILGLLARLAGSEIVTRRGADVVLVGAIAALPLGYTFITLPVAAVVGGMLVVFALSGRKHAAAATTLGLVSAVVVASLAHFWQQAQGQSAQSLFSALSYASRAPIVTPAVIASAVFSGAFSVWLSRQKRREPLAFLALGCLLLPFVISNQQVASGVMISARDWERNTSYALLVFGVIAAASVIWRCFELRFSARMIGVICLGCLAILLRAQWITFRLWAPTNLESIAIVRALNATDSDLVHRARLTFEDAGISQLVQVRMKDSIDAPLSFYKVAMNLIPVMAPGATEADVSPYENLVFEHWLRTNVSAADAERLLRTEIRQGVGTFTNYLFAFRDAWYPASDNRAVRRAELERSVRAIIGRYEIFLEPENRRRLATEPALLISSRAPAQLPSSLWIRNEAIGSADAHGVTAYVYRQSIRLAP
jgi:hypothetical protein